jgi:REP element-mobilizing transposase RayT
LFALLFVVLEIDGAEIYAIIIAMKKTTKRTRPRKGEQLWLRTHRRGGRRRGAGRPRRPGSGVPHLRRASLTGRAPVHVTLRVVRGLGNLRKGPARRAIFRAFAAGCERFGFRLVHFSLQHNHLHLVCEADDARALSRGMQGLSIRLAKALNRRFDRSGRVFADRYHARPLCTPREVRHALAYVLNNARHHGPKRAPGWMDPCSSARLFTGWRHGTRIDQGECLEEMASAGRPVACSRTWLLGTGWKRHGLLDVDEVPGQPR